MFALDVHFGSRAAMRDALLGTFLEGGLFVEGHYDVTTGSPVVVRVSAVGLPAGVFLEGLVQWRRAAGTARGAAAGAGLGVRVLASQGDRYGFLQRWSSASCEESGRRDLRYPFEAAAYVGATNVRKTARILHCRVRDVSLSGVLLTTPAPLSAGSDITVELSYDGEARPLHAHVAWASAQRAGLRLALERVEEQAVWRRVVGSARAAFESRLIAPGSAPRE